MAKKNIKIFKNNKNAVIQVNKNIIFQPKEEKAVDLSEDKEKELATLLAGFSFLEDITDKITSLSQGVQIDNSSILEENEALKKQVEALKSENEKFKTENEALKKQVANSTKKD
jgi:hypothetical protein